MSLCSWKEKAGPDGVLPQLLESSYLQNRQVRLVRGDVLHVELCEVDGPDASAVAKPCCSSADEQCLSQHESLRLDVNVGREGLSQLLQV